MDLGVAFARTSVVATGGPVSTLRPQLALVLAVLACALLPSTTWADIGVESVRPAVGDPGELVDLRVACGGCPRGGLRLPVSLVPAAQAPRPQRCRENALCAPTMREAPRELPFRFIGLTNANSRLRFAIPDLNPGRYAFVIYCGPCWRGPAGSLITDTGDPNAVLRIQPDGNPETGGESGSVSIWWVLAGAVVLVVALAGVIRWRS